MTDRHYQIDIVWHNPKMVRLAVNDDIIQLSRLQIGILYMFTVVPEVNRTEIYEYLGQIWGTSIKKPIPPKYQAAVSRMLIRLKIHGLIREFDKMYYQTMKGRAVWMAVQAILPQMAKSMKE